VDEILGVLGDALAVLVVLLGVEEGRQRGLDWRSTTKHGIVAGLDGSCAIAWRATVAAGDDTMDKIFGVLGGALAVRVVLLGLEERRRQGLDSRLTTKHGGVAVVVALGGDCAIAWKATDVSLDDTVDVAVLVLAFGVRKSLVFGSLLEERRRRRQGLDSRSTPKHGGVAVVVALGFDDAIAWKATDVLLDDTGDKNFVRVDVLAGLVLVRGLVSRQRGRASRLTTKLGGVDGLGGGRLMAWKATDAAVDDTVDGIFFVGVLAVLVVLVVEERRQRGLDWRLTTKDDGGTVVVAVVVVGGGRAIALKATGSAVDDTGDDTVDGIFDFRGMF